MLAVAILLSQDRRFGGCGRTAKALQRSVERESAIVSVHLGWSTVSHLLLAASMGCRYGGQRFTADLSAEGTIAWAGQEFTSPGAFSLFVKQQITWEKK